MTMHLLPPMFSTTGKKRGKQKHRTADAANKARRNAEAWQQLLEKYDAKPSKVVVEKSKSYGTTNSKSVDVPRYDWRSRIDPRRLTDSIPSRDTGVSVAARPADKVYTGDAMLGVSVLHKSNGVPVFRQEDAVDIAKMRRG